MPCNLFKLLLDVCVCLQLELSAGVRPVHQEEPLLGVHLLDQNGCFLVVPHLKMKCVFYFNGPFADFISISMPRTAQKTIICGSGEASSSRRSMNETFCSQTKFNNGREISYF